MATTGALHGCLASVGGQEALSTDPRQNRGAQEEAVIEPPFLWILSKGCAKESISLSGAITRSTYRRDSDLIII
ncbi:MAG: hypothetical protein D0531_03955 [Methylococcales bacterium]|nr:MAG: hypothetical protein D0531_03955 [Methylococcales bacterium]